MLMSESPLKASQCYFREWGELREIQDVCLSGL